MPEGTPTTVQEAETGSFIEQYGLAEIAETPFEAHGQTFTLRTALEGCPPFANMVKGMLKGLEAIPADQEDLKQQIVRSSITEMISGAPDMSVEDAKKKV